MKISTMRIIPGFKIRSKVDAQRFIDECMAPRNCEYIVVIDQYLALFISKDLEGNVSISEKTGDLKDIWNPTVEITRSKNNCYENTVEECIWKYRKYINRKWFNLS